MPNEQMKALNIAKIVNAATKSWKDNLGLMPRSNTYLIFPHTKNKGKVVQIALKEKTMLSNLAELVRIIGELVGYIFLFGIGSFFAVLTATAVHEWFSRKYEFKR